MKKGILEMRLVVTATLNLLPEVTWDRWNGELTEGLLVFGWLPRDDGRSDFVTLTFDAEGPASFATSSAKFSAEIAARLDFTHTDCKRVEHFFPAVNAVKLPPPPSEALTKARQRVADLDREYYSLLASRLNAEAREKLAEWRDALREVRRLQATEPSTINSQPSTT